MEIARPAAVAGTFYPDDPSVLAREIDGYLSSAQRDLTEGVTPKALIAPHAGIIYSGPVAASAYARIVARAEAITRVVLLGPAHRVYLEGVAASSADVFRTPLGDVPVDREVILRLMSEGLVQENDEAHRREHSLEVHLPFLQRVLASFHLVPLVVGRTSPSDVAAVLDRLWGGPETLIVASSDLSHFHSYDEATAIDEATSRMIVGMQIDGLDGDRACGHHPVSGLLAAAKARGLRVLEVDRRNSGDTAGPRREVVGYGSYVVC